MGRPLFAFQRKCRRRGGGESLSPIARGGTCLGESKVAALLVKRTGEQAAGREKRRKIDLLGEHVANKGLRSTAQNEDNNRMAEARKEEKRS